MGAIKNTLANVAASQTDSALIAAIPNARIRVLACAMRCGGTATNVTFNTKPAGVGTAISCLFANGVNGNDDLQYNDAGWFETNSGEGLSVTTGAGSATGFQVTYEVRVQVTGSQPGG